MAAAISRLFSLITVMIILLHYHQTQAVKEKTSLCEALVSPIGYVCHEYSVQTDDGYILGVQNIPYGREGPGSGLDTRSPVYLQHGVLAGGETWVLNSPMQSLAFVLADSGFDVWIGNTRGVQWSGGHISLSPEENDFWDWTWDELASYDFKALIGFVYKKGGCNQIYYIGHSQDTKTRSGNSYRALLHEFFPRQYGTTMLLAGLTGTAHNHEVTKMVKAAVLLAPIAFITNVNAPLAVGAGDIYADKILPTFGIEEVDVNGKLVGKIIGLVCTGLIDCSSLLNAVQGRSCCFNASRMPFYLQYSLQPTSSKNLAHFAQMFRDGYFRKYDYGLITNLLEYGSMSPPEYLLSDVPPSIPLLIVNGGKDGLAVPTDVGFTIGQLSTTYIGRLELPSYSHVDLVLSFNAHKDLFPQIISFLQHT